MKMRRPQVSRRYVVAMPDGAGPPGCPTLPGLVEQNDTTCSLLNKQEQQQTITR